MILLYNNIFLFWTIGRLVYEQQRYCDNIVEKLSNYYSYYFGNSFLYTRENIHFMKRFYMNFPIYYDKLENFSWNQYCLLLSVSNRKERTFYFSLIMLFKSNYEELIEFIYNDYFFRI